MMDYLKLLLAILLPTFIGLIFVSLLNPKKSSLSDQEKLALSFLLGCGILSLEILLLGAINIQLTLLNILIGFILILAAPLYFCIKNKALKLNLSSWIKIERFKWYETGLLVLILSRVAFVLFENLIKPVISVDAFANWSFRAKVFFVENSLLLDPGNNYFLGGGAVFYPLNIPLMQTWIFNVLGYWNDELSKIIFGLFFIALLIIFYGSIKRLASRPVALLSTYLLTTLPLLVHHATIEYADFPLCVYFTASALFLLNYFESNDKKHFYISALLIGIGTWTKTEGLPLLLINLIVLCVFYVRSKTEITSFVKNILSYLTIALIFKIPWAILSLVYHVPKSVYQEIQYEKALVNLYRLPVIINYFYNKMLFYGNWNIAWFVFVVVLIFSFSRLKELRAFYSLLYVVLFLSAFSFMYYITENYVWLLDGTTLNRNILIIMPLVIYFIAINLKYFLGQTDEQQS